MPSYVDTHCHLDHHEELAAVEQVERARDAGVHTLITIGTDMASSRRAVATAARFEGVWAAIGIHPNDAMEATPPVLEVIDRLAGHDDVVAIGETGLDYYRDHTTPQQQQAAFRHHIGLAKREDKALIVHCRDAWPDTLAILEEDGPPGRVVMHCFSGDTEVVARCVEAGYYMSFAGNVTFKNAEPLRDAALAVPDELLLTETDSPFLTPEPRRGKPNDPSHIPFIVERLAQLRGCDEDELAGTILANAQRAFALPC